MKPMQSREKKKKYEEKQALSRQDPSDVERLTAITLPCKLAGQHVPAASIRAAAEMFERNTNKNAFWIGSFFCFFFAFYLVCLRTQI